MDTMIAVGNQAGVRLNCACARLSVIRHWMEVIVFCHFPPLYCIITIVIPLLFSLFMPSIFLDYYNLVFIM